MAKMACKWTGGNSIKTVVFLYHWFVQQKCGFTCCFSPGYVRIRSWFCFAKLHNAILKQSYIQHITAYNYVNNYCKHTPPGCVYRQTIS